MEKGRKVVFVIICDVVEVYMFTTHPFMMLWTMLWIYFSDAIIKHDDKLWNIFLDLLTHWPLGDVAVISKL